MQVNAHSKDVFLGLRTLAERSGIGVRTLRTLIHDVQDPLPAYLVGGKWLVHWPEFEAWVKTHPATTVDADHHVEEVIANLEGK